MSTINEQLQILEATKAQIKQALIDKNIEVLDTDPFSSYATKMEDYTHDATATADNLLLNKTAYVAGNLLTGTLPEINSDTDPFMIPMGIAPSRSYWGTSEILKLEDEVLYLASAGYGTMGTVKKLAISSLPISIEDKSYLVRYFENWSSSYQRIEIHVTDKSNHFYLSAHDGTYDVGARTSSNGSATISSYHILKESIDISSISSDDWSITTDRSGAPNQENGYMCTNTKIVDKYNTVTTTDRKVYDYLIATTANESSMNVAVKKGAVLYTLINSNKLAELEGITSDMIMEGNTILGIEGTASSTEDLQAQLDAQDELIASQAAQIAELKSLLSDKASNISTETINTVNEVLGNEEV